MNNSYNLGRISDLIISLKQKYNVNDLSLIPTSDKLNFLCSTLGLTSAQFDALIADNSPVLRPVKGHAFEVAFERCLKNNGYITEDVGGDGDVDLIFNGHTLQLKTPNMGGTSENVIEYKTHKTHGAKSGVESISYYHKVEDFADFFVGLISYKPFKVFIIPKKKLPQHPVNKKYILSPFKLSVEAYSKYINNFGLLGIDSLKIELMESQNFNEELMPKCASKIGIGADVLVDTILRDCNFRIWDMSIRGFAREIAIKSYLNEAKVEYSDKPQLFRPNRADKADLVIISGKTQRPSFIQVKGISTNNCIFNQQQSVIATETQLTRGRVNDHPTQSRLYLAGDFDYLLLALEPSISKIVNSNFVWTMYLVPTKVLKRHNKFTNRLASLQKFKINDLQKYLVTVNQIKKAFDY